MLLNSFLNASARFAYVRLRICKKSYTLLHLVFVDHTAFFLIVHTEFDVSDAVSDLKYTGCRAMLL